ncbi:MAG: methionine ABC transporter ATP-binding protein [Rhodospirillaceae bacterium]|jgi:D-methionine transport system ATP-binding protein|nr:methionine ABC transporter ATP-binding protein [Rhodospirillaceae bacterium]
MIEIQNLEKIFYNKKAQTIALKDISLSINKNEIFGIIGRSGAGKSTLLRCVNFLERPTSGRIIVDHKEISALSGAILREARRNIGMIFQHFNLLSSRTVFNNIALPLELVGINKSEIFNRVKFLLELVNLSDKCDCYPFELSGGQKQRVGIARALALKPKVLLCDEATSSLDPETTKSILTLLRDFAHNLDLTIMLITHEIPVIKEICDRVAVIDSGKIVEQGNVVDIFTTPKSKITRRFVNDRMLPVILLESLKQQPPGNAVLRIVFVGPSTNTPVITEVIRRFNVQLNILHGNIEYIQDIPCGNVVIEAMCQSHELQAAIDYMRINNLSVEILGYVDNNHRTTV